MKVIIAGSRDIELHPQQISDLIHASGFRVTELVSGACRGVDASAEKWAKLWGIPIQPFPYESLHGKAGGPIRNRKMAEYADALIALISPDSKGTFNMVSEMAKKRKPLFAKMVELAGEPDAG